jgi:sulfatase modifying factor 1
MAVTIPTPVPLQAASTPVPAATTPSRPLPAGYQARSGVGIHPSGWPLEIFGGRDGAMMVLVPGGTFIMGRDGGEPAEAPAHQVKLSTYYIDKHEVTNRQFDQFVKEAGPRVERNRALAREGGGLTLSEDNPVVMVSAREAMEYADWASKRLPTEAQWEMAARGTDHRLYPWGPLPPVWEKPREPRQIDPVMSFPADLSPFGAYDLAGNALEWTRDWFDSRYYSSIRGAIAEDPTGPVSRPSSLQMSVRGGSRQWIVSAREGIKYESRLPFLGFRCVLPVDGPEAVFQPSAPFLQDRRGPGVPVKKKVLIPF